jgi:hypothetical protein
MGVLHSTHPMEQSFSKWNSQASSAVDAVLHAWHVVPTFLTLYNAHIFCPYLLPLMLLFMLGI